MSLYCESHAMIVTAIPDFWLLQLLSFFFLCYEKNKKEKER